MAYSLRPRLSALIAAAPAAAPIRTRGIRDVGRAGLVSTFAPPARSPSAVRLVRPLSSPSSTEGTGATPTRASAASDAAGAAAPAPGAPGPAVPAAAAAPAAGGLSPLAWWRANSARLREMMTSYGYLTIGTYLGVYVVTLAGLYVVVRAGVIAGPDVDAYINAWSVKQALWGPSEVRVPPAFTQFATAWVLTKMTEPARLVTTIAIVPVIVRRAPHAVLRAFRVPEAAIAARGAGARADPAAAASAAAAAGRAGQGGGSR